MPQKSQQDPDTIHRSQLYQKDLAQGSVGVMYEQSVDTTPIPATEVASAEPPSIGFGANSMIMRLFQALRSLIFERDNILRWELTTGFTIVAGPVTTVVPFNNQNIKGQGAYTTAAGWFFSPPPRYQGFYQVGAFLEFLTGAMANMDAARLEIWIVSGGVPRRWSVLDKKPLDHGNTVDDDYLEMVILGGNDIVSLGCGDVMTIRLYSQNTGELVISDMMSLYGYVHVEYLGCNAEATDPITQTYMIPNNI